MKLRLIIYRFTYCYVHVFMVCLFPFPWSAMTEMTWSRLLILGWPRQLNSSTWKMSITKNHTHRVTNLFPKNQEYCFLLFCPLTELLWQVFCLPVAYQFQAGVCIGNIYFMGPFASQPMNNPTPLELAVVFGIRNLTISMFKAVI